MLRTATVTELRSELASYLDSLREGPLLVLSHSKPAAILIEPEEFDRLLERVEYLEDSTTAVDADEVFERIGR